MTPTVSGGVPEQGLRELRMYLDCIKEIIEGVDHRAMAADGPVTPTLKEMTQAEMTEIYESAVNGANRANELLARPALPAPEPPQQELHVYESEPTNPGYEGKVTVKKFSTLREKMSPESQARAHERAEEMLKEIGGAALPAPRALQDDDVYRLNDTIWYDNPASSIAEAQRRLAALPAEQGANLSPLINPPTRGGDSPSSRSLGSVPLQSGEKMAPVVPVPAEHAPPDTVERLAELLYRHDEHKEWQRGEADGYPHRLVKWEHAVELKRVGYRATAREWLKDFGGSRPALAGSPEPSEKAIDAAYMESAQSQAPTEERQYITRLLRAAYAVDFRGKR